MHAWEACIDPLLQAAKLRQQRCEFSTGYMLLQQRETAIDNCHADADSPIRALGWLAQANALLQEARLDEATPIVERALALGQRVQLITKSIDLTYIVITVGYIEPITHVLEDLERKIQALSRIFIHATMLVRIPKRFIRSP